MYENPISKTPMITLIDLLKDEASLGNNNKNIKYGMKVVRIKKTINILQGRPEMNKRSAMTNGIIPPK